MKKTMLAALIAATALVPVASAQDRGQRWGNRGGDGGARAERPQSQAGGQWQGRSNWGGGQRSFDGNRGGVDRAQWRQQRAQGFQRPAPQQAVPAQQAVPRQQAQQPQRQWNRDGGNRFGGVDGQRRWNGQRQPLANAPQAQVQPQAQAQDRRQWNRDGNRGDRGQWNRNDNRGDRGQWNRDGNRGDRGQWNRDGNRGDRGQWNGNNRGDRGQWNNNRWNSRGGWNTGWRNDRRYDWSNYRRSNRNLYRLPRYYAPSGWGYGYRRFGIGFTLNSLLYSQQYWINDPFYYRLPEVDGPYRWVRYYNDALLVDIYTGEVVDTIYDIFW